MGSKKTATKNRHTALSLAEADGKGDIIRVIKSLSYQCKERRFLKSSGYKPDSTEPKK